MIPTNLEVATLAKLRSEKTLKAIKGILRENVGSAHSYQELNISLEKLGTWVSEDTLWQLEKDGEIQTIHRLGGGFYYYIDRIG